MFLKCCSVCVFDGLLVTASFFSSQSNENETASSVHLLSVHFVIIERQLAHIVGAQVADVIFCSS